MLNSSTSTSSGQASTNVYEQSALTASQGPAPWPQPLQKRLRILTLGKNTYGYTEFLGLGLPWAEYGAAGDIYLDLTPGSRTLYGRYPECWKPWPGPQETVNLLPHPEHSSRCLWCNESFGWFAPGYLKSHPGRTQSEVLSQAFENSIVLKKRKRVAAGEQHSTVSKKSNTQASWTAPRPAVVGSAMQPQQQDVAGSTALEFPPCHTPAVYPSVADSTSRMPQNLVLHEQELASLSQTSRDLNYTGAFQPSDSRPTPQSVAFIGNVNNQQPPLSPLEESNHGSLPTASEENARALVHLTVESPLIDVAQTSFSGPTVDKDIFSVVPTRVIPSGDEARKTQHNHSDSTLPVEVLNITSLLRDADLPSQIFGAESTSEDLESSGGAQSMVAQDLPVPTAVPTNVPSVVSEVSFQHHIEALSEELRKMKAASIIDSKRLAEADGEISRLREENAYLKTQLRNYSHNGSSPSSNSSDKGAFPLPSGIDDAENTSKSSVIHMSLLDQDILRNKGVIYPSLAPIPNRSQFQDLHPQTTFSIETNRNDSIQEERGPEDINISGSPKNTSSIFSPTEQDDSEILDPRKSIVSLNDTTLSHPIDGHECHSEGQLPPSGKLSISPEIFGEHSFEPTQSTENRSGNETKRDGEADSFRHSNEIDGESHKPPLSIAPPPKRSTWLKQMHRSILFANSADNMVCRICLARGVRVFQIKSTEFQGHIDMQEHCDKEHPEECETLKKLGETALRDLYDSILN